jgi:hypothetical protein
MLFIFYSLLVGLDHVFLELKFLVGPLPFYYIIICVM